MSETTKTVRETVAAGVAAAQAVAPMGMKVRARDNGVYLDGGSTAELVAVRKVAAAAMNQVREVRTSSHRGYHVWWIRSYDGAAEKRRAGVDVILTEAEMGRRALGCAPDAKEVVL